MNEDLPMNEGLPEGWFWRRCEPNSHFDVPEKSVSYVLVGPPGTRGLNEIFEEIVQKFRDHQKAQEC